MRKKIGWTRKITGACLLLFSLWMAFSPTAAAVRALPETFRLGVGQTYALSSGATVLSSTDERLVSSSGAAMSGVSAGETEVSVRLFGLFPLKKLNVDVEENVTLIPGGQAVGVALKTGGVLVVGLSDVAGKNPARDAGIRAGDVILSVDGKTIESSEALTMLVAQSEGRALSVTYERDGKNESVQVTPAKQETVWRLGVWVRDSTAGVGTLSFYDRETHYYGALGHAISDTDTGKILPVRLGSLMKARIVDLKKGARGAPGELRGSFLDEPGELGNILKNSAFGIYGKADEEIVNPIYPNGLPVAPRDSVKTGKATILSTILGTEMHEYEVEIVSLARQGSASQKSMVLRVTDQELLEKTGGIVQGMSGSPIIQNGRIVGAVTHVFVDDPTQGYGIYIEWMLENERALQKTTESEQDNAA